MKEISKEQLAMLLEAGYETRSIEFKPPFLWSDINSRWLKEKVVRAVLGMTNIRLGGQIIIGVSENQNEIILEGLTDEQLDSFNDYDGIKGYIDGFSYTGTIFDISSGFFENKKFIIFSIQEFYEIPAICKKNGQERDILKKDIIYTRSIKAPYSTIPVTDMELREIIHMAVDKEKYDLEVRGWIRKMGIEPEKFYKDNIQDIEQI